MRKTTAYLTALLVTLIGVKAFAAAPLTCTDAAGNLFSFTPAVVVTPPVDTPPPATGASWGYKDGVFSWAGDYSYGATIDYHDSQGIAVKTTQWGAWQPFMAKNWVYPTTGFTKLTFALKPTVANQQWQVRFIGVGDVALASSCNLNVLKYGPAPVVGQWATYTIPLADLCVLGKPVYKFAIQDQTALGSNLWYANNVGFLP